MKRIAFICLALGLVLSLVGCSGNGDAAKVQEIYDAVRRLEASVNAYVEAAEPADPVEMAESSEGEQPGDPAQRDEATEYLTAENRADEDAVNADADKPQAAGTDTDAKSNTAGEDTSDKTRTGDTTSGKTTGVQETTKPSTTATPKPSNTNSGTNTGGNNGNTENTTSPTPTPHTHTWVTKTVHHDEVGHYEETQVQTGTQQVQVGTTTVVDSAAWDEVVGGGLKCLGCGQMYNNFESWADYDTCDSGYTVIPANTIHHDAVTHQEPVYETQDVYETQSQWIVDTAAWNETMYVCSICNATK